jgi:hypothetical protein
VARTACFERGAATVSKENRRRPGRGSAGGLREGANVRLVLFCSQHRQLAGQLPRLLTRSSHSIDLNQYAAAAVSKNILPFLHFSNG